MAGCSRNTRPLRVDAERNRGRIVEAAQAAFAEQGLDVPLEDVAEDAGVGIATLYRRFPTRDDLIAACFERRVAEYARVAEEALEAPDGWSGLCAYVEQICAMQAADRGLKDVLTRTFPERQDPGGASDARLPTVGPADRAGQGRGNASTGLRARGPRPAADGERRRRPGRRRGRARCLAAVRRADARRAPQRGRRPAAATPEPAPDDAGDATARQDTR